MDKLDYMFFLLIKKEGLEGLSGITWDIMDANREIVIGSLGLAFLLIIVLFVLIRNYVITKSREKSKDIRISELVSQKTRLERKNRDIIDSLIYAKRIQDAMLPSEEYLKKVFFKESFVFFRPRDIVSGDFYWIVEKDNKIVFVAADCTGHGVPGALMSIIGMEILDKAISGHKVENPSKILEIMDHYLETTFNRKRYEGAVIRDGMDLSLCIVDKKNKILEFSGAFLSLYMLRDNNLTEYKGDKLILGMNPTGTKYFSYKIPIEKNDTFYLFSDGYADQFGGALNKKFMYRRFRYLLTKINNFPMRDQKTILDDNIRTWMGNNHQVDDMMVIGFRPLSGND